MLSKLKYDKCSIQQWANENSGINEHVFDNIAYSHPDSKYFEFGLLGGNTVGDRHMSQLVDLESDLTGRLFKATDCPTKKFSQNTVKCTSENIGNFASCKVDYKLGIDPIDTFTHKIPMPEGYKISFETPSTESYMPYDHRADLHGSLI